MKRLTFTYTNVGDGRCQAALQASGLRCPHPATKSVLALIGEREFCGIHARSWPDVMAVEPLREDAR